MKLVTFFLLSLSALPVTLLGQPFPLSDSGPAAPDFHDRFLGNYGVNADIEPEISKDDRPLYKRIEPYLRNDPERAIREVEESIGPEANPAFHLLLGNLYYQTNDYDKAERALKRAVDKFPSFRRAHRTLGLIFIQNQRFESAIDSWLKVITLGGGDAQSYGLLGYAYLSQKQYRSALTAYQDARMFKPESTDFRRGEAQCLLETGQELQAVALFDELIAENPSVSDYWLLQANAYLELERYDTAMANLEILEDMGKANRRSRFLLGDIHLRDDNHQLALVAYQEALRKHGMDSIEDALKPLNYLAERGLLEKAADYLETLRDDQPEQLAPADHARLTIAEAGIELERGRADKAVELLEPLVKERPLESEALHLLGEALREREAFERAEFFLQRALSLSEKKAEVFVALGRLEVERGDFDAALEHLRAAEQLDTRPDGLKRYIKSIEAAR